MVDHRTQINADKHRFPFVPLSLCPFVLKIPLLLLAFLLAACGETAVTHPPTSPPIAAIPETATPAPTIAPSATPTQAPTATPSPTAMPTVTATPTATPRPTLAISVPAVWLDEVAALLAAHNETDTRWQWQAVDATYPAAAAAPIALVNNAEGVMVAQEPLVVTVPFNHSWTFATQTDAEGIVANGHSLARAMPWSAMPPTQRPLRVNGLQPDDPDYPLFVSWSLLAEGEGWETAVAELAPLLQPLLAPAPVIKLAAVGDINLDRWLGNAIRQGYIDWPFANVAHIFQAADLAIGNLETALGDTGEPQPKNYTFQSPPEAAITLANAGFDVLSLANNHALDFGEESLLQGIDLLAAQGVAVVGAGINAAAARAPYIAEANGLRVAFLGYVHVPVEVTSHFDTASWTATADTPGLAWAVPEEIAEDVTAVLPHADLVVVMLHSGYEYVIPLSEEQKAAAYAAIDAGAHLVVGHHAHILQGVQFYKGGVIAFGLGNFAFNIDGEPNSVILNVWLDANGVRQLEFIPTIVQSDGQPRLANPEEADLIFGQIYDRSRAFPVP